MHWNGLRMKTTFSLLAAALALGLILGETGSAAEAQQFYNPWHYHHTRQQLSNRAVARRVARGRKQKAQTKKRAAQGRRSRTTRRRATVRRQAPARAGG